jgi:hypothetical protein
MRLAIRQKGGGSSALVLAAIFEQDEKRAIAPQPGYEGSVFLALRGSVQQGLEIVWVDKGPGAYSLQAYRVPGQEDTDRKIVRFPIHHSHGLATETVRAVPVEIEVGPGRVFIPKVPPMLCAQQEAAVTTIAHQEERPAHARDMNVLTDIIETAEMLSDLIVGSGLPIKVKQAADGSLELDLNIKFPTKPREVPSIERQAAEQERPAVAAE